MTGSKNVLAIVLLLAAACTTGSPATQPTPRSTFVSDPIGALSPSPGATATTPVARTPTTTPVIALGHACRAPATPTTASTEGPFFKAGSPQKDSLVAPGMPGTPIRLFGFVLTRSCAPVARAKVDIWQANASGEYDNAGYMLRGHVFSDDQGRFQIDTIVPGRYPGRTPHIHVKLIAPGGPELTTQLYMPNESGNASDGIFRPELTVSMNAPNLAVFTFVLDKP